MKKLIILILSFIVFISYILGCNNKIQDDSIIQDSNKRLATWIAYWDIDDAKKELKAFPSSFSSISYFEIYFDKDYNLCFPEGFFNNIKELNSISGQKWLTIVNDVVDQDPTKNNLKDITVLKKILSSENEMTKHIDNILEYAQKTNVQGIEIDYEGIGKNFELWDQFIVFSDKLYKKLEQNNFNLRIILEPQTPFDKINLIEGPEYIIMCYNLHGGPNDIGPKADKEFLTKMVECSRKLKGDTIFALATGGVDFYSKGEKTKSITENQALDIIQNYNIDNKIRDDESGAIYFKYVDDLGKDHEVWYADGDTIKIWENWLIEKGQNNIAIWRIGGNSKESIEKW